MRTYHIYAIAIAVLSTLFFAAPARAALLALSTHSSEADTGESLLNATLNFSVVGSALTLTLDNRTDENPGPDNTFKINQIFFNAASRVTGLTLTGLTGPENPDIAAWAVDFDRDNIRADGFGDFDVALTDGVGSNENVIGAGEIFVFTFSITGTGPFSDIDFIALSNQVDSHIISYAAAKFYDGGDISALGATNIPEPLTLILLAMGGLFLPIKHRT